MLLCSLAFIERRLKIQKVKSTANASKKIKTNHHKDFCTTHRHLSHPKLMCALILRSISGYGEYVNVRVKSPLEFQNCHRPQFKYAFYNARHGFDCQTEVRTEFKVPLYPFYFLAWRGWVRELNLKIWSDRNPIDCAKWKKVPSRSAATLTGLDVTDTQ